MKSILWAFALLNTFGQGVKPLYKEIGIIPTGNNGYEEYLAAADICRSNELRNLRVRAENSRFVSADEDGNPIELSAEQKRINGLTVFEAKQEIVRKFGRVVPLIELGNSKDVRQPREVISSDTLLPELSTFRSISAVMSACVDVAYATGNPKEAGRILQNQLVFSDNIGRTGPVISLLVSFANTALALSTIERHLGRMSLPEIRAVTAALESIQEREPNIKSAIRQEYLYSNNDLWEMLKDPVSYFLPEDDDIATRKVIEQINQLDIAGKNRLGQEVAFLRKKSEESMLNVLDQPLLHWLEIEEPSATADLASRLNELTQPVFSTSYTAAARVNIQLRILRSHMAILDYRWEFGKLPPDLSVLDRNLFIDPLNTEFIYLMNGQSYRLYSKGHKKTGEIEVRYKRSQANVNREVNP